MLYFLEAATTGAVDGANPSGGLLGMLLPLVLVIGVFYFMLTSNYIRYSRHILITP